MDFGQPVEIILDPGTDVTLAEAWSYTLDVDSDASIEASGILTTRTTETLPVSEVGPHLVRIRLQHGSQEVVHDEIVVVNDPGALSEIGLVLVEEEILEGIAIDRGGQYLYVSVSPRKEIVRLDAVTLAEEARVVIEIPTNTLEGLAVAPDEDLLYVIGKFGTVVGLLIPDLELELVASSGGQYFVHAIEDRHVIASGRGFALVDAEADSVLFHFGPSAQGIPNHFALSPDSMSLALVEQGDPTRVNLLDRHDFSIRWTEEVWSGASHHAVGFSSDGGRIYVLLSSDEKWWFFVLDALDGSTIRRLFLGSGCTSGITCTGVANPVAESFDGRFLAFPTGIGAFLVDRILDLPLYRWHGEPFRFCCNVAAHPHRNEFYFASQSFGTVSKVRLDR